MRTRFPFQPISINKAEARLAIFKLPTEATKFVILIKQKVMVDDEVSLEESAYDMVIIGDEVDTTDAKAEMEL